MKHSFKRFSALVLVILVSFNSLVSFADTATESDEASLVEGSFPKGPDATLTPGALCNTPDAHRYPEQIAYCNRNVSTDEKAKIFEAYDQLGYRTRSIRRGSFKIDHYIPLCMGGANDMKNLWPQHESVYKITDPLEPILCDKMAEGVLKQAEAVKLLMEAKANLDKVDEIIDRVQSM